MGRLRAGRNYRIRRKQIKNKTLVSHDPISIARQEVFRLSGKKGYNSGQSARPFLGRLARRPREEAMDFHQRATDVFRESVIRADQDFAAINTNVAHEMGGLGTGVLVKRSIAAYGERSSAALKQVLDEVEARIDDRGRDWRKAMADVRKALDEHLADAPSRLGVQYRKAGLGKGDSLRAAEKLLRDLATQLRRQHAAFSDGWTSKRATHWSKRRPALWLFVGALVAAAVAWVTAVMGQL